MPENGLLTDERLKTIRRDLTPLDTPTDKSALIIATTPKEHLLFNEIQRLERIACELLDAYETLTSAPDEAEIGELEKIDLLGGTPDYDVLKAFRKALPIIRRLQANAIAVGKERDDWKTLANEEQRLRISYQEDAYSLRDRVLKDADEITSLKHDLDRLASTNTGLVGEVEGLRKALKNFVGCILFPYEKPFVDMNFGTVTAEANAALTLQQTQTETTT